MTVRIERPEKIDFKKAETEKEMLLLYEKAYRNLKECFINLILEVKTANNCTIKIVDIEKPGDD